MACDVMIVDDNEGDARLLEDLLREQSLEVVSTPQGSSALDMISDEASIGRKRPVLVILDLNMPKMDGFSFLRSLRSSPNWPMCRVVVLSGSDAPEDIATSYQLGVRQYFRKPPNFQGWSRTVDLLVDFMRVME